MSRLPRAPRECGSWIWEFDPKEPDGLAPGLAAVGRMAEVLAEFELLEPSRLAYSWMVPGRGGISVWTELALFVRLDDPELVELVGMSRPAAFPTARADFVRVLGSGWWSDAAGQKHREPGLVELSFMTAPG